MNAGKYAAEAGGWNHFLIQELRKKQNSEDYHRQMVMTALRHIQRFCSNETFQFYRDAYNGLVSLQERDG